MPSIRPWLSGEIAHLRRGAADNKTVGEVMVLLPGRSYNEIKNKSNRLGCRLHDGRRPSTGGRFVETPEQAILTYDHLPPLRRVIPKPFEIEAQL